MIGGVLLSAAAAAALWLRPAPDVYMGCVRPTGEPGAFGLRVNVVTERDPLRIDTYVLVGSGGLRLADHVGQTIEVTGTLEEAGEPVPRFRVSSARPVATFCTQW